MPRLTGHLYPRRNWPTWASSVLINHLLLRIWPCRTTTCSLDWKNNWKFAIFRPTRRSLLPRRPGWTDNLMNFFWVALKSYSKGLRSVLSFVGSMLNKIPSLVAVACFLPGRAKDLPAPPRTLCTVIGAACRFQYVYRTQSQCHRMENLKSGNAHHAIQVYHFRNISNKCANLNTMNTFNPPGCSNYCAQIHLLQITRDWIHDSFTTHWRSLKFKLFEGCLTVHLPHEIKWNANLMQLGNIIDVFLTIHVSGTYAHHQEH